MYFSSNYIHFRTFAGMKWPGHEADHPRVVPRLGMHGAMPTQPHSSSWCGI